jgi:hypothetical protein
MSNTKIALRTLSLSLLIAGLTVTACKKDDDTVQENITRIQVHLTGANGFDQEFEWTDPDGGDAANATVQTIVIPASAGATIACRLHIYDDTQSPAEELTDEIEAESADHLFIFDVSGANIGVAYNDTDSNGQVFGLKTLWTKGAASSGSVNIKLYHEPTDKDNLNAPGGEVDFDVTFPVIVQ